MKLTDIALRINEHLRRFASDPAISQSKWVDGKGQKRVLSLYWNPSAHRGGSRVMVKYVSYQYESSLSREEAECYLRWLDAGNIGRHREALTVNVN